MRRLSVSVMTAALTATLVIVPVVGSTAEPPAAEVSEQTLEFDGVSKKALKDDSALESAPEPVVDESTPEATPAQPWETLEGEGSSEIIDEDQLATLSEKETTKPFVLAGITWQADSSEEVVSADARVYEGGQWTQWNALELLPTEQSDDRVGAEPLIANNATGIQVRVLTASGEEPEGLEVTLIDPGESAQDAPGTAADIASSASANTSSVLRPKVVPREDWMGAGEEKYTTWKSDYSARLDAMYVHHTAGSNTYASDGGAKIVRSIYTYHAKTLGWGDIGYQFLVDKYGNVFEGRHDAIEALPVGAQAGGYNSGTIGVSALGNYETAEPTTKLISAIVSVLSWKAYQHGLDPQATTKLLTGTSSKSSVKAAQGQYVTVPTILAHRDTNYTACPGINLYNKMSSIRSKVAAKVTAATNTYGSYVAPLASPQLKAIPKTVYPALLSDTVTFSWDKVPGATSYQIMTRASNKGSALGRDISWTLHKTVTTNSVKLTFNAGQSRYIAIRAVSAKGHSFPVKVTQITRPVLATSATASSGWTTQTSADFYGGKAKRAAKSAATLNFGSVSATRKVSVVADTSPAGGDVEVVVAGVVRGKVSLKSTTAKRNVVKTVDLGAVRSGSVVLRTAGTGTEWVIAAAALLPEEQADPVLPPTKAAVEAGAITAPKVTQLTSAVLLPSKITYKWKTVPNAVKYEIGVREANYTKTLPKTKKIVATVTGTSYKYAVPAGYSSKAYVRAVDAAGKKSGWSAYKMVNRPPTADKIIRKSGKSAWTKPKSSKYYRGYVLQNKKKSAKLSIKSAKNVKKVVLTASKQPGSGRVQVFVGGKSIKIVSLNAKKANYQAKITITLPETRSGTVTLKTLDNKPVRVSAVTLIR